MELGTIPTDVQMVIDMLREEDRPLLHRAADLLAAQAKQLAQAQDCCDHVHCYIDEAQKG